MEDKRWTLTRVLKLLVALILLPVPPGWIKSFTGTVMPEGRDESTLSAVLLGIAGQFCVLPVALGAMTIFWEGPIPSLTEFAWGSAEIVAGFVCMGGVYLARFNPALGSLLLAAGIAIIVPLTFWALPGIVVIAAIVAFCAAGRWFAPAPPSPVTA